MLWAPFSGSKKGLSALTKILLSWENTPYMPGQQCKKAGVDCVRFVTAVLDELHGTKTNYKTLPPDAAMHNRDSAISTMVKIQTVFPCESIPLTAVEPGDVVIVGPQNGGPGHALIAGPIPNTLWHSDKFNVRMTGIGILEDKKVFRIYRSSNRHLWGI